MKRRAVLLMLLAGVMATLLPIPQAFACSCIAMPEENHAVKSAIQRADGAVVGTVTRVDLSSPEDLRLATIQIEASTKNVEGESIEVGSSKQGSACGLGDPVGQRVGLLLDGEESGWRSSLCSRVAPTLLQNALIRGRGFLQKG